MARLDANKDGKLDAKELAAAERILLKLDENEDELVDLEELMGTPAATLYGNSRVSYLVPSGHSSHPGFHASTDDASRQALAEALAGSPRALSRFRELDANRDGKISAGELAGLAALTPDVELNIEMKSKGGVTASLTLSAPVSKAVRVREADGRVVLEVGKTEVTFGAPPGSSGPFFGFDTTSIYKQLFKSADTDGNGYIDRKEAMGVPFIGNQFDAIDADGDGKIFEKELLAHVKRVEALTARVKAATMALSIKEAGQGLYDLLDLNRDGVLSVRELRRAPEVLKRLKVKALAADDVPRQFSAGFAPGGTNGNELGIIQTVTVFDRTIPARRTVEKGPEWFRRMDLNRDGDVSRSEWLGTREEFDKIDTDHDGLISLEEAEAYHKKMTAKRGKR
jgi:Ca2+-binding EF-hand superfamily protein